MIKILLLIGMCILLIGCDTDLTDDLIYYDSFDNDTCVEKVIVEYHNETHNKQTTITCQSMGSKNE